MLLRPRQRNRRNALARIGSRKPIARPEKPRARSRGGARAGTGTGTRPSGAQAGSQASRFTPFSKPWEPGTSGYGGRRTRFLADMELT
jgi:hypothetical protein